MSDTTISQIILIDFICITKEKYFLSQVFLVRYNTSNKINGKTMQLIHLPLNCVLLNIEKRHLHASVELQHGVDTCSSFVTVYITMSQAFL